MLDLIRKIIQILEPRARLRLLAAMIGSVVVAVMDTLAVGLVLPLVALATGGDTASGAVDVAARVLKTDDHEKLTIILALTVVVLFILKNLGSLAFNWWLLGFVYFERVLTSARILTYYLTAPYTQMSRLSGAELMRTMDASVLQVFSVTINNLMTSFASLVSIFAVVTALFVVAPVPTLTLIGYFALAALLYLRFVKPKALAAGRNTNVASVAGWKAAFAALGALKEINLRGSHEIFVDTYRSAQLEGSRAGRVAAILGSLPRYILEILFIAAIGVVLAAGSAAGSGSNGSVGILAVFVAAGFRLLPSVTSFMASASSVRIGTDSVNIVQEEVLRMRRHRAPEVPDASPLPFVNCLELRSVSFRYPGSDRDVLKDLNLSMPFGTSLAIVGGSGAGKTTLVDVILGLHQPTTGTVLVDGVDIGTCQERWRLNLGYVPQDTFILDATVLQNVAFDVSGASVDEDRALAAIEGAQLMDLVGSLPQGLHSEVGERGGRLSGGQRQRLGIARALYQSPRLLVLDEATSALDNETEHEISQAVRSLAGSVSVIVVAHRLSTVKNVDRIIFLKDGRIAGSGTFAELRESTPEFDHLVSLGSLDGATDA